MKIANSYENCKRPRRNYTPKNWNCRLIRKLQTDMKIANWYENCKAILTFWYIVRARPIEITIKKRWFPTLKPRVSVKNLILGMVKSDLNAMAPCASKSSESFYVRIDFSEKEFNWKASCKTIRKCWFCNPSKTYQSLVEKLFGPMSYKKKLAGTKLRMSQLSWKQNWYLSLNLASKSM